MGGVLLLIAGGFVLLKAWHGWRLGVVRQIVGILCALVALVVGVLFSRFAGPVLGAALPMPERLLGPVGGVLAGLATYVVLSFLGAVLFKRTKEQGFLPVRLVYGVGGATIGAVYGLLIVTLFAIGLRMAGTVAETKLAVEKAPLLHGARGPTHDAIAATLAALKRDAEETPLGALFRRFDPVPDETYTTVAKMTQLLGNSRAVNRFLGSPELQPLLQHPRVAPIFQERRLEVLIMEHRYRELLSHPRIVAAADDPEVLARIRAIDWNRAIDRALQSAPPAPGTP